jgi:hypothetical protein
VGCAFEEVIPQMAVASTGSVLAGLGLVLYCSTKRRCVRRRVPTGSPRRVKRGMAERSLGTSESESKGDDGRGAGRLRVVSVRSAEFGGN